MIAILAITLLLGSSVVQCSRLSCAEIRKITLENLKYDEGERSPLKCSLFEQRVTFEHIDQAEYFKTTEYALGTLKPTPDLPRITVGGRYHQLFAFSIRPIDLSKGIATLVVFFKIKGQETPYGSIAVFIPLSLCDKNENADINEQLDSDLTNFSIRPNTGTSTTTSVQWLKPLLENAVHLVKPSPVRAYITDCVRVSKESAGAFFTPVERRISKMTREEIEHSIRQKFEMVVSTSIAPVIRAVDFQESVVLVRSEDSETKNNFIARKTGYVFPKVKVDYNNFYELHSLRILPLLSKGKATLIINFNPEGSGSLENGLSILVPVIGVKEYVPGAHEDLSEDLASLARLPQQGQHEVSLMWLEELLPTMKNMNDNSRRKLFLSQCEKVRNDALEPFK